MTSSRALVLLTLILLLGCERTPPSAKPAPVDAGQRQALDASTSAQAIERVLTLEPPGPLLHAGSRSAFATFSGELLSWGDNDYGQLGRGGPRPESVPGKMEVLGPGTKLVARLDSGTSHTCALMMSGGVSCWGSNEYRQLGDGTFEDSKAPVEVVGIHGHAVDLSVSGHHGCALIRDGSVRCWGSKMYEDGGMMGPVLESDVASPVPGLGAGVTHLAVGQNHACALSTTRTLCWGNNSARQLGTTEVSDSVQPLAIEALSGRVTQLAAGDDFTCALTHQAEVLCWGDGSHGQLGMGERVEANALHVVDFGASAPGKPVQVSAGATHACARFDSGSVMCWGSNRNAELGAALPDEVVKSAPVMVRGLPAKALDVRAGQGYTCVRLPEEQVMCWGWNAYGQLGRGEEPGELTRPAPVKLSQTLPEPPRPSDVEP